MMRIKSVLFSLFILMAGCSGKSDNLIKAPGVVEGNVITMKSKVASRVDKIYAEEGSVIVRGDKLADLDSRVILNKIRDVELSLDSVSLNMERLGRKKKLNEKNTAYLRKQVERFERLKATRSIAGDDLEKLKLELLGSETSLFDVRKSLEDLEVQREVLENKEKYLDLMLEDYRLVSSSDGIVLEKFVSPGENVFPGTPLMDILDRESLYVEIFIEEKELFAVKIGGEAGIVVDGASDMDLRGVISVIGQKAEFSPKYVISEVERKSLLYKVKIGIRGDTGVFKIGMPVTVLIDTGAGK